MLRISEIKRLMKIKQAVGAPFEHNRADSTRSKDDQKCRKCGKTGHSLDEFLSPYDGLCAECSPNSATNVRKRIEKASTSPSEEVDDATE